MRADSTDGVSVRRDRVVGRAAVLLAVGAISVVALTALALVIPRLAGRPQDRPPTYVEGDQIDLPVSAYTGARRTVFIFSRFSCQACQASGPTMAAIVERLRRDSDVQVVMVTGRLDEDAERRFAAGIGLDGARVLSTDMQRFRLRYIPAVVITDDRGRVLFAHEGLLTEDDGVNVVRVAAQETSR